MTDNPQVQLVEEIQVSVADLTFGDLEVIMEWQEQGTLDIKTVLPLLNKIVVGGIKHRKLTELAGIMAAITKAMSATANPPGLDGQGN
jgi:hypothetical protein